MKFVVDKLPTKDQICPLGSTCIKSITNECPIYKEEGHKDHECYLMIEIGGNDNDKKYNDFVSKYDIPLYFS